MEGISLTLHHTNSEVESLLESIKAAGGFTSKEKDLAMLVLSCIIDNKLDRLISILRERI